MEEIRLEPEEETQGVPLGERIRRPGWEYP